MSPLDEILSRLRALEGQLAERDRQIAELTAKLAERDAQLAERDARIAALEREVATLKEKLGQNSRNSGRPPSGDSPSERASRPKRSKTGGGTGGRTRGGQRGHRGHARELYPSDQVTAAVPCRPVACRGCGEPFESESTAVSVRREQVVELPEVALEVTEYSLERHYCACCGETTEGARPAHAPAGGFGPRLTAFAAMLTGAWHLSRSRAVHLLSDGFGVRMSTGAISACERRMSDALADSHAAALEHVASSETRYIDATTWFSRGNRASVWVVATAAITLLTITANATRKALLGLVGRVTGRVVCDRATVFNVWVGEARQTCWAHLLRYFEAMAQRDGASARIGEDLCGATLAMFSVWHDFKRGELTREQLRASFFEPRGDPDPKRFLDRFRDLLLEGTRCGHPATAGTCHDLLDHHWDALWTFIKVDDVEPTNNHAERELRSTVMWRQRCFGSQSERGDRFVERMGTVVRSLRKQRRAIYPFLVDSIQATTAGQSVPSILPQS